MPQWPSVRPRRSGLQFLVWAAVVATASEHYRFLGVEYEASTDCSPHLASCGADVAGEFVTIPPWKQGSRVLGTARGYRACCATPPRSEDQPHAPT